MQILHEFLSALRQNHANFAVKFYLKIKLSI